MYTHTFTHTSHLSHLPWPMHITHAHTKYLQPRRTHELTQQVGTDAHARLMVDDFVILEYLVRWLVRWLVQVLQGQSDGVLFAEGLCRCYESDI